MRTLRRLTAFSLAATVLIVACGGDEVSAAQRLVLGAAQRTFTAETAQVAFVIDGLDDPVSGEGPVDFGAAQSRTTSSGFADGDTVVINDGADSLLQIDGLTPPGRFVDITDGVDDLDGTDIINQLLVVLEPIQLLQLLNGADDADDQGSQQIDGVDTTHVTATIDFDDAIAALDGDAQAALRRAVAGLDTRTATLDVFIDADGRVRRMAIQLTLNDGTVVTATSNFTDFGEPETIRVPRARRTLAPEEAAGIVGADISGTWTVVLTRTESTLESYYPLGPQAPSTIEITCDAAGACSTESGSWDAEGGGAFSFDRSDVGSCDDTVTGEVSTAEGAEDRSSTEVRITEASDGRAVAMEGTTVQSVEVLPAGLAVACTIGDSGETEAESHGTLAYTR